MVDCHGMTALTEGAVVWSADGVYHDQERNLDEIPSQADGEDKHKGCERALNDHFTERWRTSKEFNV